MKLLITGGEGRLGRELVKLYPNSWHPTHRELDITLPNVLKHYLDKKQPDTIIHTAALTKVAWCEQHKNLAYRTNVTGTENLVNACSSDCYFVYMSTACVFHGDRGYYIETDLPYPKNFYGLTKLLGEKAVEHSRLKHLIIRTNFVAEEPWPYPKAFSDRFGTYLYASDVAKAVKDLVAQEMTGTVHVCGEKRLSMYELAQLTSPDVDSLTLADYKGAPLTVDMTLSSKRIKPFKLGET